MVGGLNMYLKFKMMVKEDLQEIISLIENNTLEPSHLTFAVEALGRCCKDTAVVVPILLKFISHESAMVREGVVYGLEAHLTPHVIECLKNVSVSDPSEGVRQAAYEAI